MADPYTSVSISGYNANPPPDDGTTGANNKITWAGIKSKLADPLDTALVAVNANVDAAFAKTLSGGTVVSSAVDYPMSASDQGKQIRITVAGKTITTPDAATVHNPFVFSVHNSSNGNITLAANAAGGQTVDGQTTQVIRAGNGAIVSTDGTNWYTTGLVMGGIPTVNPPYGFDAPVNLSLVASVGTNLLTVAVKANDGTDPTVSNPVLIPFRDSTIANGDPVWVAITSALSINTNAVGASLGTQNGVAFRFWIVAFNNAGTAVLALWHSGAGASSVAINPLNETGLASTTGISAAATSAGVFYTPNGTTLATKSFRIIGWLEYASGLATAGTYASAPTTLQLFGPGCKKPGDVIQTVYGTFTGSQTATSATKVSTTTSLSITPTSAANLIRATSIGGLQAPNSNNAGAAWGAAQIGRNSSSNMVGSIGAAFGSPITTGGNDQVGATAVMDVFDSPATVSSTTYTVFIWSSGSTTTWLGTWAGGTLQSSMVLEEVMG